MKVDPAHGRCCECGATLTIVDFDDCTLTVECERGHVYDLETDALGDACMIYWFNLTLERRLHEEPE